VDKLTEQERAEMRDEMTREVINHLSERAKAIQVYAQTQQSAAAAAIAPYPFELPAWLNTTSPPQMADIWEGQMQLWIVQDLITSIGLANHAYSLQTTPEGDEKLIPNENFVSVIDAPVKQLLSIAVVPGYLGLETAAAGATPTPGGAAAGARAPAAGAQDFSLSPTGRRSFYGVGPLYDVKHAKMSVIVDAKRIPEFLDALGQVNFMTVLTMQISEVDCYKQLQKGFYFGNDPCVQIDLLVETLWFREWTYPMMPAKVCQDLGLPPNTAAAKH
jgi:hypothetical protein